MNNTWKRLATAAVALLALTALGCESQINYLKARQKLNKGVQAFSAANYAGSAELFAEALELDPELNDARAYQAYSYMMQYIPGGESPENKQMAQKAIDGFNQVLETDPNNELAISAMASLFFNMKEMEKAKDWHRKRITLLEQKAAASEDGKINPVAAESYYTIGVINWTQSYEPRLKARADLSMKPEDPGPIKDDEVREQLRTDLMPKIDEGIDALEKALEINPDYADAMAYLNLLHRERADIAESTEDYEAELAQADEWVNKTLETKKRLAEESTVDQFTAE